MDFTLESMAVMLVEAASAMPIAQQTALEHAADIVETEAKAEIGHYQADASPFSAWRELADSTKLDRVLKGYPENEPLLRTGGLRDSIGSIVIDNEAHVGSNDDKAVWQELGTAKGIPPRSFLGGAAVRKSKEVSEVIGRSMHATLLKVDQPEFLRGQRREIKAL
jgi:phage gpG-like protein